MRERPVITALAVLAITACTENTLDYRDPEPMVFSAVASHSTKSIITTTNYPLDEPFAVEAVYYADGKPGESEGTEFIHGETVAYDFDNGIWRPGNDYFWPEKGSIRFFAGSPIIPEVKIDPDRGVEADWTIKCGSNTLLTDLCFGEVTEDCAMHSAAVPIIFNHALSQICFKARTLKHYSFSQTADDKIQANIITPVLDSVKIRRIHSKGHFTQNPRGWTLDQDTFCDYKIYANKEGLILYCDRYDNPIVYTLNTMLLIPQDIPEDAILEEWHHLLVRTSVTDTNTGVIESDITYSVPQSSTIQLGKLCDKWLMDFKYTFRLSVGDEDSELAVAITDWTETKEIILGD